jgi:chromosome segregation ATPase
MTIQSRLGSIPVIGYLLKVVHDIATLPRIRKDLLQELCALERRTQDHLRTTREELLRAMQALQLELAEAVQELRRVENHAESLAGYARKAERERSDLRVKLNDACARMQAVELEITALSETLKSFSITSGASQAAGVRASGNLHDSAQ